MPIFNKKNTIQKIFQEIEAVPGRKEVVLVDDDSTDGTLELIRQRFAGQNDFKVIFHEKSKGKGVTIRTGFVVVSGDAIIIQGADNEVHL